MVYTCTWLQILCLLIVNITILPLPRIVASSNIECPGDVIPYSCSVQSNSDTDLYQVQNLVLGIPKLEYTLVSNISRITGSDFGTSIINVVLPVDVMSVNNTEIECRIENYGDDRIHVELITSGK